MSVPNVLDEKILNKQDNYLYSVLKYKNSLPQLVGTSSLQSQLYPADIDMLCIVNKKPKGFNELQRQFIKIFNKIKSYDNLFFIEFKLQNEIKDEKYKFYNINDVNGDFFKNHYIAEKMALCKIDLLQFKNNHFQEISCIYFFEPKELNIQSYINDLLSDQKEYYNEGKYYKSLKRLLVASKLQTPPNTNLIIGITNFFNSQVGKVYQLNNYIMACQIYIEKYGVDKRVKLFIRNIGLGNMNPSKLKDVESEYAKIYNSEALKFYKHFNLPVGEVAPFMRKRMGKFAGAKHRGGGWFDDMTSGVSKGFNMVVQPAMSLLPLVI